MNFENQPSIYRLIESQNDLLAQIHSTLKHVETSTDTLHHEISDLKQALALLRKITEKNTKTLQDASFNSMIRFQKLLTKLKLALTLISIQILLLTIALVYPNSFTYFAALVGNTIFCILSLLTLF